MVCLVPRLIREGEGLQGVGCTSESNAARVVLSCARQPIQGLYGWSRMAAIAQHKFLFFLSISLVMFFLWPVWGVMAWGRGWGHGLG